MDTDPQTPLDAHWEPPTPGSAWVRRQVVEHMPDPLSPLFDELYLHAGLEHGMQAMQIAMNVPTSLVDEMIDRPIFTSINGYAYMRGNVNFRPGMIPAIARAYVTGIPLLFRRGLAYWRDQALPAYQATIARWKATDLDATSDAQLLSGMRELAQADATYWFASALVIGMAKVSDVVFNRFLALAAPGRNLNSGMFLRGFPSRVLEAEAELEVIAGRIRGSEQLRALASTTPAEHLLDALERSPAGAPVLDDLRGYFDRYGHRIYSLDFAVPTQAEDPLAILVSIKALLHLPGAGTHARQAALAHAREAQVARTTLALAPLRRSLFLLFLRWAQRYGPYREEALFYVGAAWPALRRLALELGRRLVAAGTLGAPDDVFYLENAELAAAGAARAAGQPQPNLMRPARERRALREARKQLHPPAAVPPAFSYRVGPIDLSSRESQRRNTDTGPTLRGFAVSPGRVTAPACVIRTPADFARMEPGAILVCPTTTPAWTPLFAQARGLVTDIGGVLAHGSIVAREYGIPAVMGTGNATQRIADGQVVTVDGNAGIVTLSEIRDLQ